MPAPRRPIVLAKHFFQRFFDTELVSGDADMRLTIAHILALLAVPGLPLSLWLYPKYLLWIHLQPPAVQEATRWIDRSFFITFSMVVVGFVTVLEWDALFPDRRDYAILLPLPVPLRTIFVAKLGALMAFLVAFYGIVNLFSGFLFPPVTLRWNETLIRAAWLVTLHNAAVFAGTAFVFFFFVALQGVLLNLLDPRLFRRISAAVQFTGMFVLLAMLFLFPKIASLLPELLRQDSELLIWFPPAWFLGLYELLAEGRNPVLVELGWLALRALGLVAALTAVTYFLSYRRHVRRSLETPPEIAAEPSRANAWLARLLDRLLIRHPLERAAFHFVGLTLARSKKHRLFLAAYVGVGFAFVLEGLVSMLTGVRYRGIDRPDPALLSIQLILSFFLLSGMRVIFTIPAELRANWVFRLAENEQRARCLAGVRKAMVIFGVAPLFALLFPLYTALWGWRTAALHALFGLLLSLLLMEVLLLKFRKIPFTCSYLPGKANITLSWAVYWLAFTTYAYSMARLEHRLLEDPQRLAVFLAFGVSLLAALVLYRRRLLERGFRLVFDEQPEPVVRTLNLGR